MKNKFILLLILLFHVVELSACSCEAFYYCDYSDNIESGSIFYCEVIEKKVYSPENHAMYLKVLSLIKGVGITDTIKIYGGEEDTACEEGIGYYEIGSQWIFSFNDSLINSNEFIINPDAAIENYTEYKPFICFRGRLQVENGTVRGRINKDLSLFKYPLEEFLAEAEDCDFSLTNINTTEELEKDIHIFPNPASSSITIKNLSSNISTSAADINIFNTSGQLVQSVKNYDFNSQSIDLDVGFSGLYFVEIKWGGRRWYRRLMVQ